ncbi:MAG: FAD-dependent oxidoreductase [Peptostreptococcaceae bacterium]|nr:FAD-dependent oxidoreductase [Peptostreptococcaceae bacterium]
MVLDFNLNGAAKAKGLDTERLYDAIIIGGGPAGLNAALYAKRKGLNIGIIANHIGGQVMDTSSVENYLGFKNLSGQDLMHRFEEHLNEYDIPTTTGTLVQSIEDGKDFKKIHADNGKIYKAKSIIVSTGSKPRTLGVPGEKEFMGKGVAYCAICDGPLFSGLDVIVSGGGNSAVEAAIDLAKIASTVKIVHRSQFRADQVLIDRLKQLENVEIYLQTEIREIRGERLLTHIVAFDKNEGKEIEIATNGLFIEIGYLPKSEVFEGLLEMNERKEIIVDRKAKTSTEGIFAAGDVTNGDYKQIILSAAEGATAALSANDYINKL